MLQTLELAEKIDPGSDHITDFDSALAQIELDPEQARYNPILFRAETTKIEEGIDAIYSAANAGNARARFLIMAAANNQYNSAGGDASACDEDMFITEGHLIMLEARYHRHSRPLEREEGLAMLDRSIAAIQLAIEDSGLAK